MESFGTKRVLFEEFFNIFFDKRDFEFFLKMQIIKKLHFMTFINPVQSGKPLSGLLWKYYIQLFSFNLKVKFHSTSSVKFDHQVYLSPFVSLKFYDIDNAFYFERKYSELKERSSMLAVQKMFEHVLSRRFSENKKSRMRTRFYQLTLQN